MVAETLQQELCQAIQGRRMVGLHDLDGHARTVEPYLVFDTRQGRLTLHCYQVGGYSQSGQTEGWKNIPLASISRTALSEQTFAVRPAYNPHNPRMFPVVHCQV